MRFAVGYQNREADEEPFAGIVEDYREQISEVYFALPGQASGRSPVGDPVGHDFDEVASSTCAELDAISAMGIPLTLLMNAACYGEHAVSSAFADRIRESVDAVGARCRLAAVTTTSPFVAEVIKAHAPALEVRASVNMRIGTVAGMEYLAHCFDGFYLKREFNRDFAHIDMAKHWCDAHGKTLHLLANSGCLRDCSAQTFHDNLVAHELGVKSHASPARRFPVPCWDYLSRPENAHRLLGSSWIRPEDIKHYERWFTEVKLATRGNPNPRKIIHAYATGTFRGNLLDILEPNYGSLFGGAILDNTLLPDDWFERVCACDKACHRCNYCATAWDRAIVTVDSRAGCNDGDGKMARCMPPSKAPTNAGSHSRL